MPAFVSPLQDPAGWTYSIVPAVQIPATLRHGGYTLRGVRATRAGGSTRVPATGVLRRAAGTGSAVFVEVQPNPFPIRPVAQRVRGGLPTFYLLFDDGAGLTFTDGDAAPGDEVLRAADAVTLVIARQDRIAVDPALASADILAALVAAGTPASWQAFHDALSAAVNGPTDPAAPVLLLDHAGAPVTGGSVDVLLGAGTGAAVHTVPLLPAHAGDLQRAVAAANAAGAVTIANLWGSGQPVRVRPVAAAGGSDWQLVAVEDGTRAAGELEVMRGRRHVMMTDLNRWLAPQTAVPVGAGSPALARFSRGNRVTTLVNGPEFFDDFFARMGEARTADGGVHLAGWAMFPRTQLTGFRPGDVYGQELTLERANELLAGGSVPLTLEQAASLIAAAGGSSRFLPARFFQLVPGTPVANVEVFVTFLIMAGILTLSSLNVSFARTDPTGVVMLMALWVGSSIYISHVVSAGGEPLEPNKEAVEVLGAVARTISRYAPYPARVEDDAPAGAVITSWPFNVPTGAGFGIIRHFGIYHQKMAVVRTATGHVGYCGGVDCNPDRLDDADHLVESPFHDVHLKVEGPAVADLARTFEQRWARDGGGEPVAFATPGAGTLGTPGADVVQVARTYFAPADPARRLEFAPDGDRTIADTMLAALASAREYVYVEDQYFTPPSVYADALVAAVDRVRRLIVAVPGRTDQPFGETRRGSLVTRLRTADAGRNIVQIGYARQRWASVDNELRAASGKLRLMQDLDAGAGLAPAPIALGPLGRLPAPPFWLSVDGELMWVYDESTGLPNPDPQRQKFFVCLRGERTRLTGGVPPAGARIRTHKAGAAATVVNLADIYVHAKLLMVDDVFLGVGSANLNRRGLFYDGEIQCFAVPEALRAGPQNPVLALRRRLWAEMLDLPPGAAGALLDEPVAASALFRRSPFQGNRYVPIEALPDHFMFGWSTGDGAVGTVLAGLGFTLIAGNEDVFYRFVVDPTSRLDPAP